jgi:hypothetical protein
MNHPVTAIEGLRHYLPDFILNLSWQDVESYITEGFVTRHFRIKGRFSPVGYTRAMRNTEDFTIKAFLGDKIPRKGPDIIYAGDAAASQCDKLSILFIVNDPRSFGWERF